jgi:type IV pilus assembly protein PilB
MQRSPAAQALANVPIAVLDTELAFFAEELLKAGSSAEEFDGPTLDGEAGKIAQLVRRMVWLLLVNKGGSDLHLEPEWNAGEQQVLLRIRVDGKLRDIRRLPFTLHESIVLEWKRLAGLSIEERARPQDGSARLTFNLHLAAVRISLVPTIYGEKVAIRPLPTHIPTLEDLGLTDTPLRDWVLRPRGLILFIGPTGSGKVTTMSACVQELIPYNVNIMTVQNPVEYVFPHGVTHLKVEQFSYVEGMRALLTQDPDVIVIGELGGDRSGELGGDRELAQQMVWAAETGHLVMTTMHGHSAITPLFDFLDLGIKRSLLANNVIGVVLQSLAPKLCAACRVEAHLEPDIRDRVYQASEEGGLILPDDAIFYQQTGCPSCEGRVAMQEFLCFTPAVRSAFMHCSSIEEFTQEVRKQGQLSLFAAQAKRAMEGMISLDTLLQRCLP